MYKRIITNISGVAFKMTLKKINQVTVYVVVFFSSPEQHSSGHPMQHSPQVIAGYIAADDSGRKVRVSFLLDLFKSGGRGGVVYVNCSPFNFSFYRVSSVIGISASLSYIQIFADLNCMDTSVSLLVVLGFGVA